MRWNVFCAATCATATITRICGSFLRGTATQNYVSFLLVSGCQQCCGTLRREKFHTESRARNTCHQTYGSRNHESFPHVFKARKAKLRCRRFPEDPAVPNPHLPRLQRQ